MLQTSNDYHESKSIDCRKVTCSLKLKYYKGFNILYVHRFKSQIYRVYKSKNFFLWQSDFSKEIPSYTVDSSNSHLFTLKLIGSKSLDLSRHTVWDTCCYLIFVRNLFRM